jgi:hypothetical protein
MKLSLTSIAAAVSTAFSVADALVADFDALKGYAVQFMDVMETAYADSINAGESKLQSVLAAVEAVANTKGITLGADLVAALTAFIGESKAAYNAVSAAATDSSSSASVSTAAAAPVAVVAAAASTAAVAA